MKTRGADLMHKGGKCTLTNFIHSEFQQPDECQWKDFAKEDET